MSTFEFITVLLSIVVGLGITRLLGGLGRAIEIRGSLSFYWVQGVWSINVAFYLVMFWWVVVFSYSQHETWLFLNFIHLLFYSVLLYLQAVLIIPKDLEEGTDLEEHFYSIRPWFFAIGALIPTVEVTDSLMHGIDNLMGFGPVYLFLQLSSVVGSIVAAITSNRWFHGVWCIVYLAGALGWTLSRWWSIA